MQKSWGGVEAGEGRSERNKERWTPVKTAMKRPMFVPRARGQAGRHMENASMAGAGPACFVPPSVPSMTFPTPRRYPEEGLVLL